MNAIRIRTRLESDSLHLPQLKPLIGRTVEITVAAEEPAAELAPGHGNWDAAAQAARELSASGSFDFDAVKQLDEIDLRHASDHLP
jgi:hypothetical protein